MSKDNPWIGTWRPHKPIGPVSAACKGPGPIYALPPLIGYNNHDPTKKRAPMYSFGIRRPEPKVERSPGPAAYALPYNTTRMGKSYSPMFSINGRPKDPKVEDTPGPGAYSPEKAEKLVFKSIKSCTMGERIKERKPDQMPGPTAYTLPSLIGTKSATMPSAPSFSMYSRREPLSQDHSKTPGPATYNVADPNYILSKRPPQFTMRGRTQPPRDRTQTPDPCAYYPENVTITRRRAPSFSFGIRHSEYLAPFIEKLSDEL